MDDKHDINLRFPALKFPYQTPYPDQKTDQVKNHTQVLHCILPQIFEKRYLTFIQTFNYHG